MDELTGMVFVSLRLCVEFIRDSICQRQKVRWQHKNCRRIMLNAHFGNHLHSPKFESYGIFRDFFCGLRQFRRSLLLGFGLNQPCPFLPDGFRLFCHRALHRNGDFHVLDFHTFYV